ncbi:MAG: 1-acyl-sn-glycerol-3-phosphate acyltransferase [Clostridia bacterium]|jgi:1-acyl-sn-glycerol-3-phosphate acyltransferase|nr:1-acyl-sn-glycerol-3-phosphate acyltransferase [Clostridia bacterium]
MYKYLFYPLSLFPKSLRKVMINKLARYFIERYSNIHTEGLENIPKNGNVIFIANHLSNADGLIIQYLLEKIKPVTFVAGVKLKEELITRLVLDLVSYISIHPNKPDRKAIREAIDVVRNKSSLFIFPEGTRSRTGSLLKGRSGVVLIAKNSNAFLVPVGIWGTEKLLPINKLGKMSKEWFKKADVYVKIGKPFTLNDLIGERETIDLIMLKIAELLPEKYRGYYAQNSP